VIVNVVSQIPEAIWLREFPPGLAHEYVHSESPIEADYHLIYGLRSPLSIPNPLNRIGFVASEPPEIRRYNLTVLQKYGAIFAPSFSYLLPLHNYQYLCPVAPWWVGSNAGGQDHYSGGEVAVTLDRENFSNLAEPSQDVLSVIVSSKSRTPLQIQRLKLVDFLAAKLTDIEVWGEGGRFARDKADVLRRSRYHLAVENSVHSGYWTEKLADPILMSNFVFYWGAPDYGSVFSPGAICSINPFDIDGSYRAISEAMGQEKWQASSKERRENRRILIEEQSFHRAIDRLLPEYGLDGCSKSVTTIPAHQPYPRWKSVADPVYRVTRRLLGR
jgi:hypothetical protein